MSYAVKIVADSISPAGVRLTTIEATYDLAATHNQITKTRMFSGSSSSNRAISLKRLMREAIDNPYLPERWFAEQRGMIPGEELGPEASARARERWLKGRDDAVACALEVLEIGAHRQDASRALIPYQWITTVFTATEWDNFFYQRIHEGAQGGIRKVAEMMDAAMRASVPNYLKDGDWHLPYIDGEDWCMIPETADLLKISAARAARTSYLTRGAKKPFEDDLGVYAKLTGDHPHPVPLEHVATPLGDPDIWCGNFRGYCQMRHREIGGRHMKEVA